jgi:SAM-dependent methyltransferase
VTQQHRVEVFASVLDATCGTRSIWFDREDPRALFIDRRRETVAVDVGTPGTIGRSPIVVAPDVVADFTALPFADDSFSLVVFDPPHVARREALGAVTRRYGCLNGDWREMLAKGFAECFRVLKPHGVLVFKWGESQFPVREILALTPEKPLFGHKTRKTTHWSVFMKEAA